MIPVLRPENALHLGVLRPASRRWLQLALGGVVIMVVAGGAMLWLKPRASVQEVESILRIAQAATLFAAASLGLLSGRWAARTSAGFAVATLVVLAFAGVTSATSLSENGIGPLIYTAAAAFAVALLLAAAAAPEVTDSASLRRVLTRDDGPVALLAVAALTPVLDAVLVAGKPLPLPGRLVLSAVVAGALLFVGAQAYRLDRPRLGWLPAVVGILALAAVFRAFAGVLPGILLVALGLQVLAASLAVLRAVREVRAALVGTADGMTSMLQDLGAMRDEDSRRQAEESERLHEVRSVLAGLHAATGSLRKYEDNLDPAVRRRLEEAVTAELSRLDRLVDPGARAPIAVHDLEEVVLPVVMAEREQGLVVITDLADFSVLGSAPEIATLVSDLLVNVRRHAPGSAVRLTAQAEGGVVALEVRDWGPGISAADGERVFERSYRGTRSIADGVAGCGLGLFTARRLARQMHGDLQVLAPAGGGCCFVVTLPGAGRTDEPAALPQPDAGLAGLAGLLETVGGPERWADLPAGRSR